MAESFGETCHHRPRRKLLQLLGFNSSLLDLALLVQEAVLLLNLLFGFL